MLCVTDEAGIQPAILPAPGNYQTDDPEGEKSRFVVLGGAWLLYG